MNEVHNNSKETIKYYIIKERGNQYYIVLKLILSIFFISFNIIIFFLSNGSIIDKLIIGIPLGILTIILFGLTFPFNIGHIYINKNYLIFKRKTIFGILYSPRVKISLHNSYCIVFNNKEKFLQFYIDNDEIIEIINQIKKQKSNEKEIGLLITNLDIKNIDLDLNGLDNEFIRSFLSVLKRLQKSYLIDMSNDISCCSHTHISPPVDSGKYDPSDSGNYGRLDKEPKS